MEWLRVLERENAALIQKLEDAAGDIARLQSELVDGRQRERRALEKLARAEARVEDEITRGRPSGREIDDDQSA